MWLFRLWRDFLRFALRYRVGKRWYARWRLRDVSTDIRSAADVEHDLVRLGPPVVPVLERKLDDRFAETRLTALRSLLAIDRARALPHVRRLAADRDRAVARAARGLLEQHERAAGEP
jgi:hypothetical protein